MSNRVYLELGKAYNYLTITSIYRKNNRTRCVCVCKCGNTTDVVAYSLKKGLTKSCGCLKYESKNVKHGKRNTRIYSIWCDIKKRCYNEKSKSYQNYGSIGISMCDEWKNSFELFYEWSMKEGYNDNLSIDRIDCNGNYEPDNCRWVTFTVQQNNRSFCKYISHNGEKHTISEWCDILSLRRQKVYSRYETLKRNNIDPTYELLFDDECYNGCTNSKSVPKMIVQYTKSGDIVRVYESINSVEQYGFSRSAVSQCCSGKLKTSGSYVWKYY